MWNDALPSGDPKVGFYGRDIGQLARERHEGEALLVGFSTYTGTVTAASDWGGPAERKTVRRALAKELWMNRFFRRMQRFGKSFSARARTARW